MKLLWTCSAVAVLAGASAYATEDGPRLAVCVQNQGLVNHFVMIRAQALVTTVFWEAGVRIEWLPSRQCRNAAASIFRLEMDTEVPARFGPESLAYALPYGGSGTSIHVFYERVLQNHREQGARVLGHVIAHEIGHVLEGIARHSPDGLMKARWDAADYSRMIKRPSPFAAEDVELMQLRLQSLSAASATALTAKSQME